MIMMNLKRTTNKSVNAQRYYDKKNRMYFPYYYFSINGLNKVILKHTHLTIGSKTSGIIF